MNNIFFIHFVNPVINISNPDLSPNPETILAFLFDEGDYRSIIDIQSSDFFQSTKEENESRFAQHEWSEIPFLSPEGSNTLGFTINNWDIAPPPLQTQINETRFSETGPDRAKALELMEFWRNAFMQEGLLCSPIIPLTIDGSGIPQDISPWDTPSPQEQQKKQEEPPISLFEQAQIRLQDL